MIALLIAWILRCGAGGAPAHCLPEPGRVAELIRGEVRADSTFERATPSGRFVFKLAPGEYGWDIDLYEPGRPEEDLSRLTPPWHFVPSPCQIEGWHFRNKANTGLNDGSVNAPGLVRDFIFSPEVRTMEYNSSMLGMEDVERVEAFGRGALTILRYRLSPRRAGEQARFEWMKFKVCLTWPDSTVRR